MGIITKFSNVRINWFGVSRWAQGMHPRLSHSRVLVRDVVWHVDYTQTGGWFTGMAHITNHAQDLESHPLRLLTNPNRRTSVVLLAYGFHLRFVLPLMLSLFRWATHCPTWLAVGPPSKHIPKTARVACVDRFTQLLDEVLDSPGDDGRWLNLLNFGGDILSKPIPCWHRLRNGVQTKLWSRRDALDIASHVPDAAVTSKIESRNLKAAIRLLCSDETVAPFNLQMTAHLRAKHLSSTLGMEPLPDPEDFPCLTITHKEVTAAIRSFPSGSAGRNDGLRPQHLVDLLNCKESGLDLVSRLIDFVNMMLEGECPDRIRRILFGGKLIALRKKDGGIRPIAIGCYWRRRTSKVANKPRPWLLLLSILFHCK